MVSASSVLGVDSYCLTFEDSERSSRAVVVPQWGGSVFRFDVQSAARARWLPVLEGVPLEHIAERPTSYGMPLLAPTPGRVGVKESGLFMFRGTPYRIDPPRHGLLRQRPWRVERAAADTLTCVLDIDLRAAQAESPELFRFRFRAEHTITVSSAELRCSLRIVSTSDEPQPIYAGWHPYLHCDGPCTVMIPARGRWKQDSGGEPTGEVGSVSQHDDFRKGRKVSAQDDWDTTFTELEGRDGLVEAYVESLEPVGAADAPVHVRRIVRTGTACDAVSLRNIHLYVPPARHAICLEPLSAPPNAVNLHQPDGVLEPGATVRFECCVRLEVDERSVQGRER